jgi:uncharacterized protein
LHLGVDAERQLPPWVMNKLDNAPAFAMETDIGDAGAMFRLMKRPDGKKLSEELGPTDWKRLQDQIGAGVADGLDTARPFFAMMTLAMKDLPMTPPMDSVLHERAKSAGKKIVFLESIESQIAAIEPFATAADIRALLDNLAYGRKQSLLLSETYVSGDDAKLSAMFDDKTLWIAAGRDPARFGEFLEATLSRRNRAWIPLLEQLATDGGAFVAVGAAHLVGPDNVLDLLRARGFTSTRMTGP